MSQKGMDDALAAGVEVESLSGAEADAFVEETCDPDGLKAAKKAVADLAGKTKEDPGHPFKPEVFGAIAKLRKDPQEWARIKVVLQKTKVWAEFKEALERHNGLAVLPGGGGQGEARRPRVDDHFPGEPGGELPPGYRYSPGGGLTADRGERVEFICADLPWVAGTNEDIEEGTHTADLRWASPAGGVRSITAPMETIANTQKIVGLADYDFPAHSANAKTMVEYLAAYREHNRDTLRRRRTTRRIGWVLGSKGFMLDTCLGKDDIHYLPMDDGERRVQSGLSPSGTMRGWREAMEPLEGRLTALAGLYASFAVPLLPIIKCPNFLFEFCGPTSTGKTFFLHVMASVWGDPAKLIASWDSTRMYVQRLCAQKSAMPVFLDDTKRVRDRRDLAHTIYDVADGTNRGRASSNTLGTRAVDQFRTILFSTGENPIFHATEDDGTRARALSLWCPRGPLGVVDRATANLMHRIEGDIAHNHGHAGRRFVNELMDSRDHWAGWRDWHTQLTQDYAKQGGGRAGRLCKYLALIHLASSLVNEADILPFKIDGKNRWGELFDAVVVEQVADDPNERAFREMAEWVYDNTPRFRFAHGSQKPLQGVGFVGAWDKEDPNWKVIVWNSGELTQWLKHRGYHERAVPRNWADRGWTASNNGDGRTTGKCRMRGERQAGVVVKREAIEKVAGIQEDANGTPRHFQGYQGVEENAPDIETGDEDDTLFK